MVFAELVRGHRRRCALTQDELAARSGVGVRTIRAIEAGRIRSPRPATVRLLADGLGLGGTEREKFQQVAAGAAKPTNRTGAAAARSVSTDRQRPDPAQLPLDIAGFTGRVAELAWLDALLAHSRGRGTAVVVGAVSGTAGVGKTALVMHWAHRVRHRFPDGQLYVNLRGFGPGGRMTSPTEAVRGFLDGLGLSADRIPTDLAAQTALYRSLLAGRRMLVILDNARDSDHVRPLLPGSRSAMVLITSRNHLTGLVANEGAHRLSLGLLSATEARALLAARLGVDRVDAEPMAAAAIATACARLPLALAVAAARAQQTGFTLATVAAELADAGRRLDTLDAGDDAGRVRAVFSWSYAALTPPAARLFRLLGLHRGPDITAPAAASLAGQPLSVLRPTLTELVSANLLTERAPGRYTSHDLLRAYAADLADGHESSRTRRAALVRLLDHYTHTAYTADRLLNPQRDPMALPLEPPAPDTIVGHFANAQEATDWASAEHDVLLAAIGHAADAGFDAHAWQLAWTTDTVLGRRGYWHDMATGWQTALDAARRLDHPTAQAYAHRLLTQTYARLGRHDEADRHARDALDLYTAAGDHIAQAHTHRDLVLLLSRRGRPHDALQHAQLALDQYLIAGHPRGTASAHNAAGWCHAEVGNATEAIKHCQRALALYHELDDRDGQAHAWDSLGYAHQQLGEHPRAAECFLCSLELYRELGDRCNAAEVLTHLGDTHLAAGDPAAAHTAWRQALHILIDIDHPDADGVRTRLATIEGEPVCGRTVL
jgi:tetratricopeptide (TPR) repeat protein/transcriptional regulator with XRE-family HTH domain